jgi:hypothetical protein
MPIKLRPVLSEFLTDCRVSVSLYEPLFKPSRQEQKEAAGSEGGECEGGWQRRAKNRPAPHTRPPGQRSRRKEERAPDGLELASKLAQAMSDSGTLTAEARS